MIHNKPLLKNLCWWYITFKKMVLHEDSYLHTSGWIESLRYGHPSGSQGENIPWMNYSTIALLEDRLNKNLHLFEFGSGYSTRFFAQRVASVRSIEYDERWYRKICTALPDNVDIVFQEKDVDGDYCRSIVTSQKKI